MLPAVRREVFHPYSDRPEESLWVNCYAYEEAFGEKVRALGERTRPRDLYDVVNFYRHGDSRPSAAVLRNVIEQKCAYKAIPLPTFEALGPHRADLEAMWQSMLAHQLPVLPPVADFWEALPEIFTWIMSGAEAPQRARIDPGSGEIAIRSRVLPMAVPLRARSTLEIIRFAAANHLCVDVISLSSRHLRVALVARLTRGRAFETTIRKLDPMPRPAPLSSRDAMLRRFLVLRLALGLVSALALAPRIACAAGHDDGLFFQRVATFPVFLNSQEGAQTGAEIVSTSEDGNTSPFSVNGWATRTTGYGSGATTPRPGSGSSSTIPSICRPHRPAVGSDYRSSARWARRPLP